MAAQTLLFEIGTEEIPAAPLYKAVEQLQAAMTAALDGARLAHGEVRAFATPRRMVVEVAELAEASEALSQKMRGPSAAIAFDAEGAPTKAAIGFARGKGLGPEALVREVDESGAEYVYAVVETPARAATDVLAEALPALITGISWPKSQRWGSRRETFSRPVRWLVALYGSQVIPFEYAGLTSGNVTRGHRLIADSEFVVESADAYAGLCEQMFVVASAEERAAIIREQIAAFEAETGLRADTPKGTFDEVVNLVEFPTVLVGHFDEEFLAVPPEIITDAMLEHQRYFPCYRADGTLDNAFLLVSNGHPDCSATIADGNERVVRARLSDAAFFVVEDKKQPLEAYVEGLGQVVFQEKLGTVRQKVERIGSIAARVAVEAGLAAEECADVERAALLCKCDLITSAVVEFTSLQGIMGMHYARACGESEAVAQAIADHYRPRYSGDALAGSAVGRCVAFADKLDTICGLFAIGQGPTGSSDPYALRRAALGIIAMLMAEDEPLAVSLAAAVDTSLAAYAKQGLEFDAAATRAAVIDFFITRTKVAQRDAGISADALDAVLAVAVEEPVELAARVAALEEARANEPELFADLATAYARANNLRDEAAGTEVNAELLGEAEEALLAAINQAAAEVAAALGECADYPAALAALARLRAPIDTFFAEVMIMVEDAQVRQNRLALLNLFTAQFTQVADLSRLA